MINSLLAVVARIAVGRQIVAGAAWVHDKLDGHRSEISLGILALVHGLKLAGVIPAASADSIEKIIAGIIPVVLADKASKVIAIIDKVVPVPSNDPVESPKP